MQSDSTKFHAHLTRTSDTSCMIDGDSDDERKTRVHLLDLGKPQDSEVDGAARMLELSRIPLDSRTELVQATRKKDSVWMRTVELWQPWFLLQWAITVLFTRECFRQRSGHMDKPVFNVRANLHKYKMKLLLVWGRRLCEIHFAEHFHGGRNQMYLACVSRHDIVAFSRIKGQMSSCTRTSRNCG